MTLPKMERIEVGRYTTDVGYKGWIGGKRWIVFYRNDGTLVAYNREPDTGAVIGEAAVLKP